MSEYLKPGLYKWNSGTSYWRVFEDYHEVCVDIDFKGTPDKYNGKQKDDGNFILIQSFELPMKSRFEMILEKV